MCCTGRRHAEKNKRKVRKEARRDKWTAAHLGVCWRQSGRQRKKERREKMVSGRERATEKLRGTWRVDRYGGRSELGA